ncbi:non-ribosomal peptide synthetase [Actinokineospora spheciospongiae]|uniref:Non-ribosomal peptide synthetase n=1 Tax=Actinokineospora spheciospongiae TaxID=909613 RepID=W7J2G2_9PSEU|nr:condensation domain-containing protein [Actinokineospora spheciospongiae]EWC60319.1 non-ribosomal peptide synthetase [Actinokineospora spheciospongiae]PWW52676.1 condensation domain-containing protein [Actinokineospora spheciospongiae]
MADTILVDFHGPGAGVGELTWGQRTVWRAIALTGESETMGGIVELPPGTTVEHTTRVLRYVMGRHQSLRTLLRFDAPDGGPRQEVHARGTIGLEVVDAGGRDPAAVAAELRKRYETTGFDSAKEWPVRMGVVVVDGAPTHSVAVYNHLALDAHGMEALIADLATMDPETGEATVPLTAVQPLELARQQQRPHVRRNSASALDYWERVLRTVSPLRVEGTSEDPRSPRWGTVEFTSPAALLAGRAVAARLATDTSPVLLAAFATALATTIGNNPVALQLAVGNRFRDAVRDSVCTMAQTCPLLIDLAGATFPEAVARARQAAVVTYKYAYYDPEQRAAMVAAVKEDLGVPVELDCYFNDRRPPGRQERFTEVATPAEIEAARALSIHEWTEWTDAPSPLLYLNIDEEPGALRFGLTGDTHRAAPAALLGVLTEVESVLVAAADPGGVGA